MLRRVAFLALLITAELVAACRGVPFPWQGEPGANPAQPITLIVSTAADLTCAFAEIGKQFESETGTKVVFNFGSSGQLAQQIERGAPVDVFAAADVSYVEELEKLGLILPGTKQLYARGRIVLWTQIKAGKHEYFQIERLEDLARPEVRRVAIANPDHAPYGRAAREALQTTGIWEMIQPKLVLGENVRQTLQYAETGDVDVAIVAFSLVIRPADGNEGRWVLVPQHLHRPIDQALAVVKGTAYERQARAFADYVAGLTGQTILREYGFETPGP
jgi:molybdate transport system substrate-binding protein